MKKYLTLLFIFLLLGCSSKDKKEVKKEKTEKVKVEEKVYFSYVIPNNPNDDYYEMIEKERSTYVCNCNNSVNDNVNIDTSITMVDSKEENKETENKEEIISDEENNDEEDKNKDVTKEDTNEEKNLIVTQIKSGYYSPSGKYLGDKNVKVIDVSYYQKDVDWNLFYNSGDYYGVILRLGYFNKLDKKFERNISELKRLNIPYGIYLFSYAINKEEAKIESNFVNSMIDKYDIKPALGIYYDIESWNTSKKKSSSISKNSYDQIIGTFINSVSSHVNGLYKVKVYSGRWYAMNKFNNYAKSFVDWVAEYNKTCKYDSDYTMWQYTSKGRVPGISGNVDISYIIKTSFN